MRNLEGKYCIVTGAGKGIGKAIAKRFLLEQAAGVAILEWDLELAKATAKELDPTGEKVIAVKCNVADSDMVKAAVDETLAKFGRIDVLINNAGVTRDRIFHKMTDEEWHTVIDINLNGVYNLCKFVVPLMRDQESGAIVNISSTSLLGNPGQANYAATKAALQGFTRTLGKELGRKNVRVNCIAPGHIDTDMMRAIGEEKLNAAIARLPMQRLGDPDEIATVAAFLCTDDSSWVTGQTIMVSGGASCT
ncbi:MAG: 3-oxoacyl-ACP reductase FabG [Oscillospiraceae bacterium]|nr:3-oxoacyl-ACP reductase FabG [Oscillospiraceae bacterium]